MANEIVNHMLHELLIGACVAEFFALARAFEMERKLDLFHAACPIGGAYALQATFPQMTFTSHVHVLTFEIPNPAELPS